ncbi:MAG: aminoacyl-histidine dipeptidase [Clostridium sp.]
MLENLAPKSVFKYFEEISKIPRGSYNEKGISDYLVQFAKKYSLDYIQDKNLNVLIKKPATVGYEHSKGVILQGHMDMVCEKNNDTNHDFNLDPLNLRVINDMIYATNTTLGADNGVAIAYSLAILESTTIPHPPLEVLITTQEEVGMGGAINLDNNLLQGDYLINLDSEEEGSLLASCCGGIRSVITLSCNSSCSDANYLAFNILVNGLKGGHSGMDIIKQRGNSNIIMGRVLSILIHNNIDFYISSINGGSKMNAIPRESTCNILIHNKDILATSKIISELDHTFKNEYKNIDEPNILMCNRDFDRKCFDKDSTYKIVSLLSLIPNGVVTMSPYIQGLPQSSTNLGIVKTSNGCVNFESAIRSSVLSLKKDIMIKHSILSKSLNANIQFDGDYPEWEFSNKSHLQSVLSNVYKDMFNKTPNITAIHAGLECGILKNKYPHLDMISFGPDHFDVHSPNEHLSISSTERMWEYLLGILAELK